MDKTTIVSRPVLPRSTGTNASHPLLIRVEPESTPTFSATRASFGQRIFIYWRKPTGGLLRGELTLFWVYMLAVGIILASSLFSMRWIVAEIERVASTSSTKTELDSKASKSDLAKFQANIVATLEEYQQQTIAQLQQAREEMGGAIAERRRTEQQLMHEVEQLSRKQNEQSQRQKPALLQATVSKHPAKPVVPLQAHSAPPPPTTDHPPPSISHPAYDSSLALPPGVALNVGSDGIQDWKVPRSEDGINTVFEVWPLEQTPAGVLVYVPSEDKNWFITPEGGWMGGTEANESSP